MIFRGRLNSGGVGPPLIIPILAGNSKVRPLKTWWITEILIFYSKAFLAADYGLLGTVQSAATILSGKIESTLISDGLVAAESAATAQSLITFSQPLQ